MVFESIEAGVPDPMFDLKRSADSDLSPSKVDLGVGIYRNESGSYQELECVRAAKTKLSEADLGHDYEITTGNREFLDLASQLMFCESIHKEKLASVQTISGTGAVHLAALFIAHCISPPLDQVYVGIPAWGNYKPAFELVGLQLKAYRHYDPATRGFNHESTLQAIRSAPSSSVFILQACCHNPTGADPSPAQWDEIVDALQEGDHLPLFDVAYHGLGQGLAEDVYSVRRCAERGLEMLVCQSFSKNFALYGERCGALHVACGDSRTAANVHSRLRSLIRWEISSSPAYGSRLVKIVLSGEESRRDWETELSAMRGRIQNLRFRLFVELTDVLGTPGDWKNITQEKGMFSFLKLSPGQCAFLTSQHRIYLPPNGRINVSGLNESNISRVARAIDKAVRSESGTGISSKLA